MIDRKSTILFGVLSFVTMIMVVSTYYKYVILKDFSVFTDKKAFDQALSEE